MPENFNFERLVSFVPWIEFMLRTKEGNGFLQVLDGRVLSISLRLQLSHKFIIRFIKTKYIYLV